MDDFYRTHMGQKFFEQTMPSLVTQLKRLNDNIEKLASDQTPPIPLPVPGENGMQCVDLIVSLLKRPQGCTHKEAEEALGWPSISFDHSTKKAQECGFKVWRGEDRDGYACWFGRWGD